MATQIIETVQARLKELGYYTGRVDGDAGTMTSEAVIDFKEVHGFVARDYVGPLTISLLFSKDAKAVEAKPTGAPPWYDLALSKMGLHETSDNSELRAWLRADGSTLGDPAILPWCGDFVETAIKLALPDEPHVVNPYLARNWLKFGRSCDLIRGAVCVFWRGSRNGTSGHVGFVAGEDATTVHVLGGNQSNQVSITRISKARLLGCRWPTSYPLTGERVQRDAVGEVSLNEA